MHVGAVVMCFPTGEGRLAVALAERGRDHDSLCAGATRRTHDLHIDQRAAKRQHVSVMQEVLGASERGRS